MKFTDKFVLVPIERYERLTKELSSDKDEENKEVSMKKNFQKGEGLEIAHTENRNSFSEGVDKSVKAKQNLPSPIPNKSHQKLPPPFPKYPPHPPGIPNKIKKPDFRWINYFK